METNVIIASKQQYLNCACYQDSEQQGSTLELVREARALTTIGSPILAIELALFLLSASGLTSRDVLSPFFFTVQEKTENNPTVLSQNYDRFVLRV